MANILVKPFSDSDGNLVILADNMRDLHLVDVTTGEIIERGRNAGASNGRGATFRFTRPGSSYRNVGLMDHNGNILVTLETAGDRVQFNYSDYNALVRTPVSTINGYRWDNSANQRAQAEGRPSNANIGEMTSEEYMQYLQQQQGQGGGSRGGSSGGGAAGTAANIATTVGGAYLTDALSGVDPIQEAGVWFGNAEGPLTETQSWFSNLVSSTEGGETAANIGREMANQAAESGAQSATEAGAIQAGETAGQQAADQGFDAAEVAKWAAIAYEAYKIGDLWTNNDYKYTSDEAKTFETAKRVGLAVADLYTGGLASLAYAGLSQMGWWQDLEANHPLNRKTTDQYQMERWANAANAGATDADKAFFASHIERDETDPGVFAAGPLAGRKYNWDEVKVFLGGEAIAGEYAFAEAFPDWLSGYTEQQREDIAQAAIDEGLLINEKGSVLASNSDSKDGGPTSLARLRQIGQEIKDGTYVWRRTEEQREEERRALAEKLGINYTGPRTEEQKEAERLANTREGRDPEYAARMRELRGETPADTAFGPQAQGQPQGAQRPAIQRPIITPPGVSRDLPPYREGAGPGTYRAPDGVNTWTVREDGSIASTLIGVAPVNGPQLQQRPPQNNADAAFGPSPDFLNRQVSVDSNAWMPTEQQIASGGRNVWMPSEQQIASGGRGPGPVTPDEVAAAFQDKTPQSLYDARKQSQSANTQSVFGGGQPQAIPRAYSSAPGPQGAPLNTRMMVPTDTDINPPITDYEQIDGASLPPPGADNALMAWNFLQSAPSQSLYSGLMDEVFATSSKKKPLTANFEQLQGAFSS